MKTSKLKTATVFIAFTLIATLTVSAYNGGGRNYSNNNQSSMCVNEIPGMSQQQVSAITTLENEHQKAMDQLRSERRSTTSEKEKAEIRIKMIDIRDSHRAEVKKLLTPEQQSAYNTLHANGNNHQYSREGNRSGRGNFSGSCKRK